MKNKTKKPKLITSPFTSLGISFSPGDPHLVAVRGYGEGVSEDREGRKDWPPAQRT
jgi:hypothetical protein